MPWVVTGALENVPGLVVYSSHMFVEDTLDGGASAWLPRVHNGTPIKRWRQLRGKSEELPPDWPPQRAVTDTQRSAKASPAATSIYCNCKGVQFTLRSAVDLESVPEKELPWYIEPQTLKYRAKPDVCDSCRITSGVDMVEWAYAPLSHIEFNSKTAQGPSEFPASLAALRDAVSSDSRDPRLGTLAMYQSSPGVERYFCAECSANVFYSVHDRDGIVDIAVGLLDHPDGARAEGLLAWSYGQIAYEEDAREGWREGLVSAAKAYGKERLTSVKEDMISQKT
ncbi:hypothetical protein CCHL11_03550 [Colletotrichum chlorophyti]|uniref:Uncharacterized protein n=1 Tax=Colletotrichum chlorophyti TaxID=708187 RepID=A0A1Q8RS95_9PEZI|nr:hypothetical protein CCHL11_03550 [Colletotrichum chlorophyti]